MINQCKKHRFKYIAGITVFALIFTLLMNPVYAATCMKQDDCSNALAVAQSNLERAEFDEAINLLTKCLNKGFTKEQMEKGYRLLGLSYIAKDLMQEARKAVWDLVSLVPDIEPDMDQDPKLYRDILDEMKTKYDKENVKGGPPWLLIAGGALVGGIVAVLTLGGNGNGNGRDPLPQPPSIPPVP